MARLVDADELKHDLEWLEGDTPVYLDVMSTIDERTTVDAEPVKHGHWERAVPWIIPTCSVCGENAIGLHAFDCKLTDYCPHCGAKMDEVE